MIDLSTEAKQEAYSDVVVVVTALVAVKEMADTILGDFPTDVVPKAVAKLDEADRAAPLESIRELAGELLDTITTGIASLGHLGEDS